MEHKNLLDKCTIIAPSSRHARFRRYNVEYPDADIIVMTLEELQRCFCYFLEKEEIEKDLRKAFQKPEEIEFAFIVLEHINLDRDYPIEGLNAFRHQADDYLKKGLITKLDLAPRLFQDRAIIIDGYHDGTPISRALDSVPNICVSWFPNPEMKKEYPRIAKFVSVDTECEEVMRMIGDDIIAGIDPGDIVIQGAIESYLNPLQAAAKKFGIPLRVDDIDEADQTYGIHEVSLLKDVYAVEDKRIYCIGAFSEFPKYPEERIPLNDEERVLLNMETVESIRKRKYREYCFTIRHPNVAFVSSSLLMSLPVPEEIDIIEIHD